MAAQEERWAEEVAAQEEQEEKLRAAGDGGAAEPGGLRLRWGGGQRRWLHRRIKKRSCMWVAAAGLRSTAGCGWGGAVGEFSFSVQ